MLRRWMRAAASLTERSCCMKRSWRVWLAQGAERDFFSILHWTASFWLANAEHGL